MEVAQAQLLGQKKAASSTGHQARTYRLPELTGSRETFYWLGGLFGKISVTRIRCGRKSSNQKIKLR